LAEKRRGDHGYWARRPNAISAGQYQANPLNVYITVPFDLCLKFFDDPGDTAR
jgi:hypothetical protein